MEKGKFYIQNIVLILFFLGDSWWLVIFIQKT